MFEPFDQYMICDLFSLSVEINVHSCYCITFNWQKLQSMSSLLERASLRECYTVCCSGKYLVIREVIESRSTI